MSSNNNQGGASAQYINQAQGNNQVPINNVPQGMPPEVFQQFKEMMRSVLNENSSANGGNSNANNNSKKKQKNKNNSNQNKNNKNDDNNGPVPGFGSKTIKPRNKSTKSIPNVTNVNNNNGSNQLVSIDWNDDENLCCQIPISGKLVTPKSYKLFQDNMRYYISNNVCPIKSWCDKFGIECTEENYKKLGFNTNRLTTGWKKSFGWKVHSSPNFAYENKFGIKPYYGPQWDKEGKMMEKWFDGRPKENNGASNGVSNVGVGIRGIPIYPDGGAVYSLGFGGSAITSGPLMHLGY